MTNNVFFEVISAPSGVWHGLRGESSGATVFECHDISMSMHAVRDLSEKLNKCGVALEIALEIIDDFLATHIQEGV